MAVTLTPSPLFESFQTLLHDNLLRKTSPKKNQSKTIFIKDTMQEKKCKFSPELFETAIRSLLEDHKRISVEAVPRMCFSSLCLIIQETILADCVFTRKSQSDRKSDRNLHVFTTFRNCFSVSFFMKR
jgi:hypothetical protein